MRSKKPDLEEVVEQFEAWRGKPHGRLIPDKLWKAALALLDRYAPSTICQHLRFNSTRFKQVREARGTVMGEKPPMRRERKEAGERPAHTRRPRSVARGRAITVAPVRNAFVEFPPLGVGGSIMARTPREVGRGPSGCRLTLESAFGTITVVTASAEGGWVDVFCRFLVDALADGSRT